jgi:hypothetical protein
MTNIRRRDVIAMDSAREGGRLNAGQDIVKQWRSIRSSWMTLSIGKWLVKNQMTLGLVIFGLVVSDSCSSVRVVFVTGKG